MHILKKLSMFTAGFLLMATTVNAQKVDFTEYDLANGLHG